MRVLDRRRGICRADPPAVIHKRHGDHGYNPRCSRQVVNSNYTNEIFGLWNDKVEEISEKVNGVPLMVVVYGLPQWYMH